MPFPSFKTKDEIPAAFLSEYEEKGGEWVPKIAPADDTDLKGALKTEREKRDAAEKLAKKLADERADMERRLTAAQSGDEKDKVAKALAKFDADLAAEKARNAEAEAAKDARLRTYHLDEKAKAAFIKAGGRPDKADAALKLHKEMLDLSSDDRIVVKDAKGEVTSATIEDFWSKTVRKELPEFYAGTKAAGGGGTGGSSVSPINGGGKWDGDAVLKDPLGALQAANADAA